MGNDDNASKSQKRRDNQPREAKKEGNTRRKGKDTWLTNSSSVKRDGDEGGSSGHVHTGPTNEEARRRVALLNDRLMKKEQTVQRR